jgi:hypothetical protein
VCARERERCAGNCADGADREGERQRGAPGEGDKYREERGGQKGRHEEGAHVCATAW